MLAQTNPTFLLASSETDLLAAVEPVLLASGARVEIVLTTEAALVSITDLHPPTLALLDVNLPGMDPRMTIARLLAAARPEDGSNRLPIVLISDTVTQDWTDRLAEGVADDLILRGADPSYWRLRLDMALRAHRASRELEALREAAVLNTQIDRLTGIYNRETILAMLFRETDRVQRMNSSLCMILFDIDDFGHWNARLGAGACDQLLCQVVSRAARLLRSYDLLGRPGKDEFLVALPGCSTVSALMLAERLRLEVFSSPFPVAGESVRLSASFGIASSQGRSPVVVLREAEQALQWAKEIGPESIQCFGGQVRPPPAPVTFLSPTSGDELLAW
jgi:diguanylate cyclase (GGDEF)-like protein